MTAALAHDSVRVLSPSSSPWAARLPRPPLGRRQGVVSATSTSPGIAGRSYTDNPWQEADSNAERRGAYGARAESADRRQPPPTTISPSGPSSAAAGGLGRVGPDAGPPEEGRPLDRESATTSS